LFFIFNWNCIEMLGEDLSFSIRLPKQLSNEKITGRLFVFSSQRGEPRLGPNWFQPEPFFGKDISNWKPGSAVVLDDNADCFPVPISKLPQGKYRFQALLDHDFYSPSPGNGVGNFYSEIKDVEIKGTNQTISFDLVNVIQEKPIPETKFVKIVKLDSRLLGNFHKRSVFEKAVVVLPAGYHKNAERRYPVFYEISGFGATLHQLASRYSRRQPTEEKKQFDYIHVLLTGECKWGHHVYANSATNGPRGDALVKEMIPLIDSRFRTVPEMAARYVGGHSSGGWSSIWLQVNYPDTFGGLWSTAPDPVDFRDYQQTNLYSNSPESIYYFKNQNRKPLARRGRQVMIWYPDFAKMDDTLGRGGQLRSFEAVFSPLDHDGKPAKMWNRLTGIVDPEVVKAWKQYDLQLILKNNWKSLAPKLKGKMHILMGTEDTFYLEGATQLLSQSLKKLGSDAEISIIPGNHSSIMTPSYFATRRKQMKDIYQANFNSEGIRKR
ncbi:MAG: alpha/beta hydrolase-fold protein, partial [Planctomycetota bacterium]|nr:alpha/beta hydrolase-fold protein [Planctomycetota bacterium]